MEEGRGEGRGEGLEGTGEVFIFEGMGLLGKKWLEVGRRGRRRSLLVWSKEEEEGQTNHPWFIFLSWLRNNHYLSLKKFSLFFLKKLKEENKIMFINQMKYSRSVNHFDLRIESSGEKKELFNIYSRTENYLLEILSFIDCRLLFLYIQI